MYDEFNQAWQELTAEGAQFEVARTSVNGQQIPCFKNALANLRDVWLTTAAFGHRDYLIYNQERWSYDVAHAQVGSIANWLVANAVGPGDRVAIAMRNYPEWILSYWAVLATGAAVVGMNAWWTTAEMVYVLDDAKPKVMICDQERLEQFSPHRGKFPGMQAVIVRARGEMPQWTVDWIDLISGDDDLPMLDIDTDSDACIFYTSGTTGTPKGAQLTHRGCVSNIMNLVFAASCGARTQELRGLPVPAPEELPPPVYLVTTPLFHVTANNCVTHPATLQGGKLVMMYRWDAERALELIEQEKVSTLAGVPVMSREVLAHPNFATTDLSSLRSLGGGGAPLQPDLVGKIAEQTTDVMPSTGYGMTETCGVVTANSGDMFIDKPESCGRVLPSLEIRVVNDAGEDVPVGQIGELWVRGEPVISGYLNRPKETAESITDGWFHTGDLGRLDEQEFVYLVDRKKDMVLRGGENIYCVEVENAIFTHQDVVECAVFSVQDERLDEEVGVAVVLKEGAEVDAETLRDHCREQIAEFKIPRYIWFQDEALPSNANGKFLKRELQAALKVEEAS